MILVATLVTCPDGKHVLVSTVSLAEFGYNLREYETMVFEANTKGEVTNWSNLDCERYEDLENAVTGHEKMVKQWTENAGPSD